MKMSASFDIFLFGDFRLDRAGGGLFRRGADGAFIPVAIGSRAIEILGALVERRGEIVSKEEIMGTGWPRTVVAEGNLFVQIAALRRILDGAQSGQSCIQTVIGRGYRFVAPARRVEPAPLPIPFSISGNRGGRPDAEDGRVASLPAGLPTPDKPSIAVLPFTNLSGDPEQDYFADGMVEEIITALSRIRWLFVLARNSSFTYKGQAIDVKQVGRELGVRYLLEGSVRRGGNRVRISAQLIEAETGAHLWADRFDGSLEDVFDLQDMVASSVAGVIEPALQAAETARSASRRTSDLSAYDLYLRADAMYSTYRLQPALALLEEAIARDPHYGPALGLAAQCCQHLATNFNAPDRDAIRPKGIDFGRRAVLVAGDDPGVLADAAMALAVLGEDLDAMISLVDHALALNPSFARGWHISGFLRLWAGQTDLAIEHGELALRLSPRARAEEEAFLIGTALFFGRRFAEAVPRLWVAIEAMPAFPNPYRYLAACYAHMGLLDEARAMIARLRAVMPEVMVKLPLPYRNPEHRELFLSGLRLAMGETSVGMDQRPRDLSRAGVEPSVALAHARSPEPQPSSISAAERRQLTVMICDLVGARALAARLDPEDLREIIAAYHRAIAEIAAGFDGLLGAHTGDDVMVYFGYPQAHEDDAERAVRAGLGAIDAVGRLDVGAGKLQARVGIATGLVVVGDPIGEGPGRGQSVVGEAPQLAAGLQALAEPDTVVIAAGTHRLVGALFEYCDLGAVEVEGTAAPVQAWQVLRPSTVASRFEALRGSALSPLVGRDEEIDLLLRRWARAKTGDGQVVLVSGEPGIGKSRIVGTLAERLQAEPYLRLRYFCSPYHRDSALSPFVDQLSRAAGFTREDSSTAKLEKLEALLALAAAPGEDIALLADLLSLPASERHRLPNLSPQRKKERTLEALLRQLEALARQQPIVTIFEDAHWIDPTSRELLDLVVERVRNLPVLLLVTYRPEFQPLWTGQPQVTMLALNRLDRRDRTVLVAQIAGGKAVPHQVIEQIADRTDGVPLFIEELTKSVLESGLLREQADRFVLDGALPPFAIPTTLHASLLARLDRLASVRHVAQIGAAIGRQFSYEVLRAVSRLREAELHAALARLVASGLVFQRGTPPDAVYSFKHALVQDAAHDSLLRSSRQRLHAQIAEALEAHSPELMENQLEIFAQHYAEAGHVEKSVACWGKAGHRSAARSAMAEAAAQFQKGLDQLALLPDDPKRQRQELEFRTALSAVLHTVKGLAAPETGHAHARARELWEQLGSPSEFLGVPYAQAGYHTFRGEFDLAQRLTEDLLRLSRQRNDSAGLVLGHYYSGVNLLCAGRFASTRAHLEGAVASYDRISHGSLVHQAGIHPQVISQAWLGVVLFCLGFPDQAAAQCNAAIAEARRLAHPPSLAGSLAAGARLLSLLGNDAALAERADQLIAVASDQGFPYWRAQGVIYRGWVEVKNGVATEGISVLRGGLMAYRATGAEWYVPHYTALLAAACEIVGQVEETSTLLDDALRIVERTGERWFAAELNRYMGQMLLRQGHREAAEELYGNALSISQDQEAKLWELRAAASLARLWGEQDRREEARDLLSPVYGWFTEGFETPDLKEAKALLAELE
jgi:TolB-like protein/class 3 adenylate cyclase/predicted ATPase/DNA-binding winged helix-turn-helix (wHTH) protein